MQHTLPPPPAPQAPTGDTFYQDMLRWVARLVFYPFYRPFTQLPRTWGRCLIAVGLRLVLMTGVLGILVRLSQHALLTWALEHHKRSDPPIRPAGLFPLQAPLLDWQIAALLGILVVLLLLDRQNPRWPIHLTWEKPFFELGGKTPVLPLPAVDPQVLVLGRPYSRIWDETENSMVTTLLEEEVYTINQAELCTHATVVAPTRAGKTYNVTIPLIEFTDRVEGAGIFIDAKGDDLTGPVFDGEYPGAFHLRFNLLDWEHSFRLQVWVGRTVHERAERLAAALIRDGNSEESRYFSHNARVAFINLVQAHAAVYRREPTFPELIQYLRNAESRAKLGQQLPAGELKDALLRIEEVRGGKRDVLGGLDAILDPLAQPQIARFFARADDPGYTIEDLLQAQARVCFTVPTGPHPDVAPLIGRMVISQFTQAVLDPANNTEYLKLIVVEDATNFVTPLLGLAMAQASSHNAAYVLIFQDLAQIRDESLVQEILTNTGLKIVLGGIGDADSARFSKVFGTHERLFRTQTASSGRGQGQSASSGSHRGGGSSQRGQTDSRQHNVGWGLSPRSRPDFTPTELRRLPDHHAVIEKRDNRGHLTPAILVHFDAELVRTLTGRQRQELLGAFAEPMNHLHPFFAARSAPAVQRPPTTREAPTGSQQESQAGPVEDRRVDGAADREAGTAARRPNETPDDNAATGIPDPPPPPDLQEEATAASENTRPLAPSKNAAPPPAPSDPPNPAMGASSGPVNSATANPAAPSANPATGRGGRRPPPLSRRGRLVQPRLPLLPPDSELTTRPAALPVPPQPPTAPTTPDTDAGGVLNPATTVPWLMEQLNLDAGFANFVVEAANRSKYTEAAFAALVAQVAVLPDSPNRRALLSQQVARNLPALGTEPDSTNEVSRA